MSDVPELRRSDSTGIKKYINGELIALVESAIAKYKVGLEVWYNVSLAEFNHPAVMPDGSTTTMTQPVLKIWISTRGILLGPENMIHSVAIIDPVPTKENVDKSVMVTLQNIQEQRAMQMNGPSSAFGKKDQ